MARDDLGVLRLFIPMNKILTAAIVFVMTRTKLVRSLAVFIAGLFVGYLGLTADQIEMVVSALVILITAGISLLVETKNAQGVKEIQADAGTIQDGYAGPKTQKAVRQGIHGGRP